MRIEDKLYLIGYKVDEDGSHLEVNEKDVCKKCKNKACTFVCPVDVYKYDEKEEKLAINYDACVECGTCKIVCEYIDWRYPRGGFGVAYKFG